MKLKKLLVLGLALACIATISITATLAYFTDTTEAVKNTFTIGKVEITMDELDVDEDDNMDDNVEYPVADGDPVIRDLANEYKLIPSETYTKDPTIHVDADSEPCFLFVCVENGIAGNIEVDADDERSIASQMTALGWVELGAPHGNIWAYCGEGETDNIPNVVDPGEDKVVFNEFTIRGEADNQDMEDYKDREIKVIAYAVQAAGLEGETAKTVWETVNGTGDEG